MTCRRCNGKRRILYFGRAGMGGQRGPCWCQPEERKAWLATVLKRIWGGPILGPGPKDSTQGAQR